MSLKKFFNILKENNIKIFDAEGNYLKHWILDKEKDKNKREIVMSLFKELGDNRCRMNNFILTKQGSGCSNPLCVNPDCYSFRLKKNNITDSIVDVSEEIDLESYYEYGEDEYLKMLNDSVPSILRITKGQLKSAVLYLTKMKGN